MKFPENIKIVAAIKNRNENDLKKIYSSGITNFGENRLQEHLSRKDILKNKKISWHFIGRLQTNKLKEISKKFHFIHSISRMKEIRAIYKSGPPYPICLIQINLGDESKSGIEARKLTLLLKKAKKETPEIPLRGLMTMPPYTKKPEKNRLWFREVKKLGEKNFKNPLLSMGTTQDWEIAFSEGSNILRIGRALFE